MMNRCAIVVGFILAATATVVLSEQEDPCLTQAFEAARKSDFPKPSPDQQRLIRELSDSIQAAAQARKSFHISDEMATAIGRCGIPHLAPLLRDGNPWVRGMVAKTLLVLDRKDAVPFLMGILLDDGAFDWMDDVRGVTVGSTAASALRGLVHQTIRARVPAAENGTTMSERKALQSWFAFHIRYYDWKDHPKHGVYWYNGLALYTSTPAVELTRLQHDEPQQFQHVLVIWPEDDLSHAVFSAKDKIRLRFIFQNFGTQTVWVRWDKRNRAVHALRLVGPKGEGLALRQESIPPLPKNVPVLQPLWNNGAAMGWELSLAEAYDLSHPGVYRLYYSYRPPTDAEPKEQTTPVELRFWDGRQYVNYYEFRIKHIAEPPVRGDGKPAPQP